MKRIPAMVPDDIEDRLHKLSTTVELAKAECYQAIDKLRTAQSEIDLVWSHIDPIETFNSGESNG